MEREEAHNLLALIEREDGAVRLPAHRARPNDYSKVDTTILMLTSRG